MTSSGSRRLPQPSVKVRRALIEPRASGPHDAAREVERLMRLFTLIGGLTGCTAAFAMTIWMNLDWPTLVGGKAIAAIPAFVVPGFELTVLLGALASVAGVVLLCLMLGKRGVMYDPRFSDDRIGVFVPAGSDGAPAIERLFRDAGAVEVRHATA